MSQADLAARAGFKTQSAIGNLENRATGRGGFNLPKIASVLGVPLEWLLEGPDVPNTVPFLESSEKNLPSAPQAPARTGADHDRAIELLQRLPSKAMKEAIVFLEYLAAKHNTPSSHGADHPVPAPARKAA